LAIQLVTIQLWRGIPGRINITGDSQNFTLEFEVSFPPLQNHGAAFGLTPKAESREIRIGKREFLRVLCRFTSAMQNFFLAGAEDSEEGCQDAV
jgi:hypothetical protein